MSFERKQLEMFCTSFDSSTQCYKPLPDNLACKMRIKKGVAAEECMYGILSSLFTLNVPSL